MGLLVGLAVSYRLGRNLAGKRRYQAEILRVVPPAITIAVREGVTPPIGINKSER